MTPGRKGAWHLWNFTLIGRFHQALPSPPPCSLFPGDRLLSRNLKLLGAWQGQEGGWPP